jgi:2-desacetyl-2-hydroxyethyl bacteriochlorophyllide A dehydrogenase
MPHSTQAIVFDPPNRVTLEAVELPEANQDEVLLETYVSVTSPGTELRALAGLQVGAPESGGFIPGYAAAGTSGTGERFCWAGSQHASRARLWGGHVGQAVVHRSSLIAIPDGVSEASAAYAQIAGIAHRGLEFCFSQAPQKVIVVGLGLIGLSSALLHRAVGNQVLAIDRQPERLELAQTLGLQAVADFAATADFFPDGAEVVVDASGVPSLLARSVLLLHQKPFSDAHSRAKLIVQGSYATDMVLPYDPAFVRELELYVPRDRYRHNVEAVLGLLAQKKLPTFEQFALLCPASDAVGVYANWQNKAALPIAAGFVWQE